MLFFLIIYQLIIGGSLFDGVVVGGTQALGVNIDSSEEARTSIRSRHRAGMLLQKSHIIFNKF